MDIFLLILKLLVVVCCLLLINSRNAVLSVLYLVLVFGFVALLFLFLGVEFIAFILLVVYVGAICILFLFVVMMLNVRLAEMEESFFNYYPVLIWLGAMINFGVFLIFSDRIRYNYAQVNVNNFDANWMESIELSKMDLKILGEILYTYYFLGFLGCGIMLLVAMVGAILLTFSRKDEKVKSQNVSTQVLSESIVVTWRK